MVANLLNATGKFTETLEDMRKQELMESRCKASRKHLDFDEIQVPPRARRQVATPERKSAQSLCKQDPKQQHNGTGSVAVLPL